MSDPASEVNDNDIAIIGMAIRVPGAATPEAFWENLASGRELVRDYSEEELLERGVSRATLADPNYVRAGIPLEGVDQFDPEFFGFSQKEAAIIDPQHRHFYEVSWEAIERAGHPPDRFDGAIGVFAGCGMGAYFAYNLLTNSELLDTVGTFLLRHTGNDKDFLSTRVSYLFDLKGPSVNVQTACSTSLVATHMAIQSLLSGECDIALAGGATIEVPHGIGYLYKEGEVLSPDGHCRPFDHRSKGTVFGSGAGVVVLRRLAEALEDGDHIHAVIKGSAVNNDGSAKVGYLAPSVDGQAAAVAEALAVADLSADSIGYVECHGTATPVGDPIEITALTNAFRETSERTGYCRIGSVKSNIGHLDTAAGVASLIKAALALEHGKIPPSLNYEAPNPNIDFEHSPFRVADRLLDWDADGRPRRAGVNSLGVGGTNAFVILEEAPSVPPAQETDTPHFLTLSARSKKALDDAAARMAAWLREHPEQPLDAVSHTLANARKAFEHRKVLACRSAREGAELLEQNDPRRVFALTGEMEKPRIVFMFPGGGAQYFGMGRGLYREEPIFREQVDRGLELLRTRHGVDLGPVFHADEAQREAVTEQLAQPSTQLPLIFIIEHALVKLLAHYGVRPDLMIGHSMGENTAACVAGVLSFEDALGLLLLRGQLVEQAPPGGVLSVPMPAEELQAYLGESLDLASANSRQLSVASGAPELLDDLAARLAADGIESQRVKVNVAAHSRLFDGILQPFGDYLRTLTLSPPQIPIISNRTGAPLTAEQAQDPDYWVAHLRRTVLFGDGIDYLAGAEDLVFLEVGPGNMLGSFARQSGALPFQRIVATMRHPEDGCEDAVYLRAALGRLHALGCPLNEESVWRQRKVVPVPTYPFQHAGYWYDPGEGRLSEEHNHATPMRLEEEEDWFSAPRWVQQGILEYEREPRTWLVLHGQDPVSQSCVERLRESGHTVVEVYDGDVFARLGERLFSVAPEAGGDGYQQLMDTLVKENLVPDRVLHTWLLTFDRSHRPGSTFFHRIQNHGFYSLFYLARALGKAGLEEHECHFIVAANGSQSVAGEKLVYPTKATVLGPCLVTGREFPGVTCSLVDLDIQETDPGKDRRAVEVAGRSLWEELTARPENSVVARRGDVRWRRHIRPLDGADASGTIGRAELREGGVYFLTGGLGGIATVMGSWLARRFAAKLILTGRTPLPEREEWQDWLAHHPDDDPISAAILKIQALEAEGAEVLYRQADVTILDQVREAVAAGKEAFGRIDGVMHIAGTTSDSLIQLKTPKEIEEVFSTKVYGTLVLDEAFASEPLDFMILFGSTSAFVAPQGQVDYVAANSFINAFAEHCRGQKPYPVVALNWGIWADVGMVAPAEPVKGETSREPGVRSFRQGTAQVYEVTRKLSTEADWVIHEHRLGTGEALLPGTGYFELIREAASQTLGELPFRVENVIFQSGLFVEESTPRTVCVRMVSNARGWHVDVLADLADGWETCATAQLVTELPEAPDALDIAAIAERCTASTQVAAGSSALQTRQEEHLNFGARWHVLKRLALGDGEAMASITLPEAFVGDLQDHPIHPAMLDIGTGCAMDLIPGYAEQPSAEHLWVPMSYGSFTLHAPFQPSMHCWIRYEQGSDPGKFATFHVSLTDPSGNVLATVESLTLSRLDGEFQRPGAGGETVLNTEAGEVSTARLTPGELALQHNITQGITAETGVRCLERFLSGPLATQVIISSMDLQELAQQADYVSRSVAKTSAATFERPDLDSDFEPPRDEIEQALADMWTKLLGVEGVGIHDSFFDLGGHSLVAVRLFNEMSDRFGTDLPMSVLMQSPTIEGLAELIRGGPFDEAGGESAPAGSVDRITGPEFHYVVPMNTGTVGGGTPLFMVAGMFGNVLNLSHLAQLLGEDRPFYALQARGLFGGMEPHESFQEMAEAYIEEIRQVQPTGPYLLGGFSGGGLVAYEIARQLLAEGESVFPIIMLDTPVRDVVHLSLADRISMAFQDFRRMGPRYILEKIRERNEWARRTEALAAQAEAESGTDEATFRSQTIGNAFIRALRKYEVPSVPVDVCLFRPKQHIKYYLSGGRQMDEHREYVAEDNGWTPYVSSLDVNIVPGDHDSMVLEPNVRVLVGRIKAALREMGVDEHVDPPAVAAR